MRKTPGHKQLAMPWGFFSLLDFYDLRRAPSRQGENMGLLGEGAHRRPDYPGGAANSMVQSIDVTQIVDRQPVSRFLLGVIFLCTLVTLADGYNISVIAFAAPAIVKAWHLKS